MSELPFKSQGCTCECQVQQWEVDAPCGWWQRAHCMSPLLALPAMWSSPNHAQCARIPLHQALLYSWRSFVLAGGTLRHERVVTQQGPPSRCWEKRCGLQEWWSMTRNVDLQVLHVMNTTEVVKQLNHTIVSGSTLVLDFPFFQHPVRPPTWHRQSVSWPQA